MTVYNKLVRDRTIEYIEDNELACTYTILERDEHVQALHAKLHEEAGEFAETQNIEELADILEAVFTLANMNGVTDEELQKIRAAKLEARGGFTRGLMLLEVAGEEE